MKGYQLYGNVISLIKVKQEFLQTIFVLGLLYGFTA